MSAKLSAGRVRKTHEFIKGHGGEYSAQMMCRVLGVAPPEPLAHRLDLVASRVLIARSPAAVPVEHR